MKRLLPACVLAVAALLSACTSSPTGRQQVLLFSEQDMSQLGAQSFDALKQEEKIYTDRKTNQYVQCVTNALTAKLPGTQAYSQWEVVVFDSDQINAFALPGGKIGVYTGLLKVAVNQDQLATVIGHEIGHVMAQHSNERLSRSQLANMGMQISSMAMSGTQYHDMAMAGLGLGMQYGVLMPYGRSQESESDIIGLRLMAEAGFDPNESIRLWQNMAKASGGNQPPELLSTHPSHSTRIDDLRKEIGKLPTYNTPHPQCRL
ncbi:M48 family metallopeptidase [Photobacterium ganghwense]|uniref:Zn-dependent protease n=1 Tax=Photobacterium ganghwense TaxID=320778 RepID=A0A0J1H8N5_9GAMM|nr:M48 family metallopeptidase [Photobacterium ganghwense]KLV08078.1 Zn-dependent protease [Photobacterium ganghwense]MBV1839749.1 M48 family metallopeptidase [Photobacterium ganghwense]PSU07198.1 M48 family peptidase [Photobacterium ganghwense]QSV15952.1 M48 family metallopeptidase [Photobacterium ganghwense]